MDYPEFFAISSSHFSESNEQILIKVWNETHFHGSSIRIQIKFLIRGSKTFQFSGWNFRTSAAGRNKRIRSVLMARWQHSFHCGDLSCLIAWVLLFVFEGHESVSATGHLFEAVQQFKRGSTQSFVAVL